MDREDRVKKAMEDLKDFQPTEEQLDIINQLREKYSGKSEEDIFVEIIKINDKMEAEMEPDEYETIFEKLESIRPFLDEEQQKKLDKILKALGKK